MHKGVKIQKSKIQLMLKTYCVLITDYREQQSHIENYFAAPYKDEVKPRKNVVRLPLIAGDYTFAIFPNDTLQNGCPIMFERELLIEKKSGDILAGGGFAEMKHNISGAGHAKFKEEFQFPAKNFYLLLENTTDMNDIFAVKRGQATNDTYNKAFNTFLANRNDERQEKGLNPIEIIHCNQYESGRIVKKLIIDYVVKNFDEIQDAVKFINNIKKGEL